MFLQNPQVAELAEELASWLGVGKSSNYQCFAIADMSMLDARLLARMEWHASPGIRMLDTSRYAAYEELGPQLIPMENLKADKLAGFLSASDGFPGLSFVELQAPAGVPQLQALVWLAEAKTTDDTQLYCRYADTRILPVLLDNLAEDQTAVLAASIRRWAWINRQGQLSEKSFAAPEAASDDAISPLSFDDAQFSTLMQAAEADLIFGMLRESSPEIIPQTKPFDIHRRLSHLLDAGRERGIVDAQDQLQFAAIAWSSSEAFYQLPCLAPSWEIIRSNDERFSDVLKTWDDTIWAQIDALNLTASREPI